jgi:cephalosporin hydroxylase
MSEIAKFFAEVAERVDELKADADIHALSRLWLREVTRHKYSHNFTWLGRPIIQLPQDLIAMQELIWKIKPAAIVETGIAHGGSLLFYSSMLDLVGGDGIVVGVDVDIRAHNKQAIEDHPFAKRVAMIQGSSIDPAVVAEVFRLVGDRRPVLVSLDSNHTHAHVLAELEAYSPLVVKGSYLIAFDTAIEDVPKDFIKDRPWGPGNSPKSAVHAFLKTNRRFEIDKSIDAKLSITVAPDGYLRCISD